MYSIKTAPKKVLLSSLHILMRELNNDDDDDDDGSENVAKKMNLRSFKLYRVYLDSLNLSNGGDVSWSWILMDFIQVHKEKGKFLVLCSRPV